MLWRMRRLWIRFWLNFAGLSDFGRLAAWLSTWFVPPYNGRCLLAALSPRGFISPNAKIHHSDLRLGKHVYIGERVVIYEDSNGGPVELGDHVELNCDCLIVVGRGGSLSIGSGTSIQNGCQIEPFFGHIQIGKNVLIGPRCAFFCSDYGVNAGELTGKKPPTTKGSIMIEDGAWLGYGVIVSSGVRIGKGAVVGAGSVVTSDIPDQGIAVGVPAKLIKIRSNSEEKTVDNSPRTCK